MYRRLVGGAAGLIAVVVLGALGCKDITTCTADLGFQVRPTDTTIVPGEQFTIGMQLFGCGGRERLNDSITFVSSDIGVVVVGTSTGVVIGARSGIATVTATAHHYHVSIPVTVRVR